MWFIPSVRYDMTPFFRYGVIIQMPHWSAEPMRQIEQEL